MKTIKMNINHQEVEVQAGLDDLGKLADHRVSPFQPSVT